ncbi:MAG: T9SS type A sorting domain-containing protein, partial [Lentimicrobium sp.]|nr:T9SS type A sorting domain-containing protein [Lentimicrobium sp.]
LLGAKFDASTPYQDGSLYIPNTALRLAIDLRKACNWWQRKPVYLDTYHITQIPEGIEVRHFKDSADTDIFVIDNWNQLSGTSFIFEEKSFDIPDDKLSIIIDSIPTIPVPVQQHARINFKVFPNPAKDYFTVVFPEKVSVARLSVLDILGHKIREHLLENGTSFTIPADRLSAGIYFLKLEVRNKNTAMQKIIVNK